MKMILIALTLALTGCAATYTYDGKQYPNAEQFRAAIDSANVGAASQIVPLPAPVTKRRLALGFPSTEVINAASVRNHTVARGSPPMGLAIEQYQVLADGADRGSRGTFEAIKRRGIYPSVRYIPLDSMTASPAPSESEDVLYYNETSPGAGGWYYATTKGGRQVFAWDRVKSTMNERAQAFIDALQLQAIRD